MRTKENNKSVKAYHSFDNRTYFISKKFSFLFKEKNKKQKLKTFQTILFCINIFRKGKTHDTSQERHNFKRLR